MWYLDIDSRHRSSIRRIDIEMDTSTTFLILHISKTLIVAKVVLFYVWMSKSWKLCKNYPCAHAITTYLQRKSWDRGKGWSISLWSLRCLYPDLSRLTGTTRCAVVKLEVTSTTVKQGNLSKDIGNKTIRRFSKDFTWLCLHTLSTVNHVTAGNTQVISRGVT